MKLKRVRFLVIMLALLMVVFGIHLLALNALDKPLWGHRLVLAYLLNYILASIVLFLVERGLSNQSAQAGFIFLAGSGLKFLIFFLVFYPFYKKDGALETIEFITFFVPYGVCLILEVAYLSKQLNNQ